MWIGGCVGAHNHRFFYLLLVWLFLGLCGVVASLLILPISRSDVSDVATMVAACFALVVGVLLLSHTLFIATNQTSLEVADEDGACLALARCQHRVTPFDLGVAANFRALLRLRSWADLLNPFARQAPFDPMAMAFSPEYTAQALLERADEELAL